jgi:hypothetical protein
MASTEDEKIGLQKCVVAYLDVMGQKEKLKMMKKVPTNEVEKKEFFDLAEQTYGVVKFLRDGLKMGIKLSDTYIDNVSHALEHQKTQQKNLLHISFFSDSYAIASRYYNDKGKPAILTVFSLLFNLSFLMIYSLGKRAFVRGAIEVGKGFEWSEGGVYGPIMSDVYELENHIAWYPRIVVGGEVNNCISDWLDKIKQNDNYYINYKEIIDRCRNMVCIDKDGIMILDYLGLAFHNHIKDQAEVYSQTKKVVKLGWDFVSSEYDRFKNSHESQMALKCSTLKDYFSSRLNIWE